MKIHRITAFTLAFLMAFTLIPAAVLAKDSAAGRNLDDRSVPSDPESTLANMTTKQKVGQLFFILPEDLGGSTGMTNAMRKKLNARPAGGVILYSANIQTPDQLTTFIKDLQSASQDACGIPLFIGIDEEGGRVLRIGKNPNFPESQDPVPPMFEIGETHNPENAFNVGAKIGGYLRKYGVNTDFAPVADVWSNPQNHIGDRSFGKTPDLVASMVEAAIEGFQSAGTLATVKHFPGYGDTVVDPHEDFVTLDKTWAELEQLELIPFHSAIATDVDMIMAAHLAVPKVTGNDLPATLSHTLITQKLRNEMGYDGVVITDGMSMGAITKVYTPVNAAKMAINAGCDIVLGIKNYDSVFDAVLAAVNSGEISEARVNESVLRILKLKAKFQKHTVTFMDWDGKVLKTEQVEHGSAATPPEPPVHEGYTFTGWDKDFTCIISDLNVYAQYESASPALPPPISKPGDYDGDGRVTTVDALMILRAAMGLIEGEIPAAADVDGNGIVNTQDALLALRIASLV